MGCHVKQWLLELMSSHRSMGPLFDIPRSCRTTKQFEHGPHRHTTKISLRKLAHAIYSFFRYKHLKVRVKKNDICVAFARRGDSSEYPQFMFWIKNKKIPLYTPLLLYKSWV